MAFAMQTNKCDPGLGRPSTHSMRSELDRFIERCDTKLKVLLALCRDANKAARPRDEVPVNTSPPPHFNSQYRFPN